MIQSFIIQILFLWGCILLRHIITLLKNMPAIATTILLFLYFSITTCFGPCGPSSSGIQHQLSFQSAVNYYYYYDYYYHTPIKSMFVVWLDRILECTPDVARTLSIIQVKRRNVGSLQPVYQKPRICSARLSPISSFASTGFCPWKATIFINYNYLLCCSVFRVAVLVLQDCGLVVSKQDYCYYHINGSQFSLPCRVDVVMQTLGGIDASLTPQSFTKEQLLHCNLCSARIFVSGGCNQAFHVAIRRLFPISLSYAMYNIRRAVKTFPEWWYCAVMVGHSATLA
jgi:hypothetical protein